MAEQGYLISKATAEAIAKLIGKPVQPKTVSRAKFVGGGNAGVVKTVVASIDGVVCNEDGTITINYTTTQVYGPPDP